MIRSLNESAIICSNQTMMRLVVRCLFQNYIQQKISTLAHEQVFPRPPLMCAPAANFICQRCRSDMQPHHFQTTSKVDIISGFSSAFLHF